MTNKQKILIGFAAFLTIIIVGSIVTAIGRNSSEPTGASINSEDNISEEDKEELEKQLKLITNNSDGFEVLFFEDTEEYEDVVETKSGNFDITTTKAKSEDHAGLFIVTKIDDPAQFASGALEVLLTEKFFDLIEEDTEGASSDVGRYSVTGIEGVIEAYEIDARLKEEEIGKDTVRTKVATISIDENTYLSWVISSYDIDVWSPIISSLKVNS